ncbi:hypothetical protein HispidOSU_024212 [Sigmodon hispidus]
MLLRMSQHDGEVPARRKQEITVEGLRTAESHGELDRCRSVEDEEKAGADSEDHRGTRDPGTCPDQELKDLRGGMEGGQHKRAAGGRREESEMAQAPAVTSSGSSSANEKCISRCEEDPLRMRHLWTGLGREASAPRRGQDEIIPGATVVPSPQRMVTQPLNSLQRVEKMPPETHIPRCLCGKDLFEDGIRLPENTQWPFSAELVRGGGL